MSNAGKQTQQQEPGETFRLSGHDCWLVIDEELEKVGVTPP
jgi:hypothetical protein